jgi:hypothetical protein
MEWLQEALDAIRDRLVCGVQRHLARILASQGTLQQERDGTPDGADEKRVSDANLLFCPAPFTDANVFCRGGKKNAALRRKVRFLEVDFSKNGQKVIGR